MKDGYDKNIHGDAYAQASSTPYKDEVQRAMNRYRDVHGSAGELSDGYHTFNELYDHRAKLFAALCLTSLRNKAWKSLLHNDPNEPMYDGMFIVGVDTRYGQATYHYDIDPYWALFKEVREVDRAPKFDGHTPADAIKRIYLECFDIATKPAIRGGCGFAEPVIAAHNTDLATRLGTERYFMLP